MGMKKYLKTIEALSQDNEIRKIEVLCLVFPMEKEPGLWMSKETFAFYPHKGERYFKTRKTIRIREPTTYWPTIEERYKEITKVTRIVENIPDFEGE